MTMIHGGIGRQEVNVDMPVDVLEIHVFTTSADDGERSVVVAQEFPLGVDEVFSVGRTFRIDVVDICSFRVGCISLRVEFGF